VGAATHTEIVDELVQLFDQALAATDSRARHVLEDRQGEAAAAEAERLVLLDEILDVVLDTALDDAAAGAAVRGLGQDRLAAGPPSGSAAAPGRRARWCTGAPSTPRSWPRPATSGPPGWPS
jgi:hypothetical protein